MTFPFVLATGLAGLALWLAFAVHAASRRRTATRAGFFDAVAPLFDRVAKQLEPTGFARMTGHLGPRAFDLRALPDSLTFRKLPALWVMVSLPAPLPVDATLDILTRPSGQEPFTGFSNLPQALPCPDFLPEGTGLRSDNAARVPPAALIARHAGLFDDPSVKELLISPKGLRLVILGEEAERGHYLIFRDAEVGQVPLSPARLSPLLAALAALRDDLVATARIAG